jgi:hypothetical protein
MAWELQAPKTGGKCGRANKVAARRAPAPISSQGVTERQIPGRLWQRGFRADLGDIVWGVNGGYVMAARKDADAFLCHAVPPGSRPARPFQPNFLKPGPRNAATFLDRRDDIEAVVEELLSSADLREDD